MNVAFGGAPCSFKDIDFNSELSASSAGQLFKVTGSVSTLERADLKAVRAWNVTHADLHDGTFVGILPQFSKINADGDLELIVSASSNDAATGSLAIAYVKQPDAANRGDFEDRIGNATVDQLSIPEVNLELRSLPIVAKTRKLKAVWSPELAQDLNAYHSVDAEAELTSMLSDNHILWYTFRVVSNTSC